MTKFHEPVLADEVMHWMNLQDDGVYCDCTLGGGGHLLMMLKKTCKARFIGIDWDSEAIENVREKLGDFRDRVKLYNINFSKIDLVLNDLGIKCLNGILFDLGASWYQLTTPARGFSFNHDGSLLMQMTHDVAPLYKKLAHASYNTIYRVLREYGDVPKAHNLARSIFENRQQLKTTFDLRRLVQRKYRGRLLKKYLHLVFQAFRIWVNDELTNLKQGLIKAINYLAASGRLIVIAYHSGEDRIVKNTFRAFEQNKQIRRLNKKVIKPSQTEIKFNPAARSARMRVAEKCAS
ncbi:MAG: 16S rRNA (cytosine(1402)-N(4))-methyltransferase RsmH [bacterium]